MWGEIAGGLISAASSLFGGQSAADAAKEAAQLDFKRQKVFAQNQIQWRAEDAKAAGIHPLAALGMGGSQYSPFGGYQDPKGAGIARAGEAIGEAVARASIDTSKAQAELLRAQTQQVLVDTANTVQGHSPTSMRVDGGGDISRLPRVNLGDPDDGSRTLNALDMTKIPPRARDDTGITRGNPDNPAEFEADIWQWLRDGTFRKNMGKLLAKNRDSTDWAWNPDGAMEKLILKMFKLGDASTKKQIRDTFHWLK